VLSSPVVENVAIDSGSPKVDMYFDYDSMRWKHRDGGGPLISEPRLVEARAAPEASNEEEKSYETMESDESELYFDYDSMRWQTRSKLSSVTTATLIDEADKPVQVATVDVEDNMVPVEAAESKEEMYFDMDSMRWKSRIVEAPVCTGMRTAFEAKILQSHDSSIESKVSTASVFARELP
jgi:hypothetical protein